MLQFDGTIEGVLRCHKSSWTGVCNTCELIWPCPPVRAKLKALFATDKRFDDEGSHHRPAAT